MMHAERELELTLGDRCMLCARRKGQEVSSQQTSDIAIVALLSAIAVCQTGCPAAMVAAHRHACHMQGIQLQSTCMCTHKVGHVRSLLRLHVVQQRLQRRRLAGDEQQIRAVLAPPAAAHQACMLGSVARAFPSALPRACMALPM